jgi:hypothetical protein
MTSKGRKGAALKKPHFAVARRTVLCGRPLSRVPMERQSLNAGSIESVITYAASQFFLFPWAVTHGL